MLQYYLLLTLEVGCEVKGCETRCEIKILEVHKKEVGPLQIVSDATVQKHDIRNHTASSK